jgi:hypothetical protein
MRRLMLMMAMVVVTGGAAAETAAAGAPTAVAPVRVAAVGDIACKNLPGNNAHACRYDAVSDVIAAGGYQAFLALGDEQYEYGRYQDFLDNYDAYFGRLLPITRPVPGNHEYGTDGGAGYFRYFGAIAHGPRGWYSFELGGWHVIALNSAVCSPSTGAPCGPGSRQYDWLKADLDAHPNSSYPCTLAYWHHPVWDWEKYQNNHWITSYDLDRARPFWRLLVARGADVVLNGHNHNYQRYAPMDGRGRRDRAGIREFIVGTGGRNLNGLGSPSTLPPTLAAAQGASFGALALTLRPGDFSWRFQTAAGSRAYADSGSAACH